MTPHTRDPDKDLVIWGVHYCMTIRGHDGSTSARCLDPVTVLHRLAPDVPEQHPCWPHMVSDGPGAGDSLGGECKACGHLVALHSRTRGCVGCQVLAETRRMPRDH